VFFFWFLRLVVRGGETASWRVAFLIFALAPLISTMLGVIYALLVRNNLQIRMFSAAIQSGLGVAQLSALGFASAGDMMRPTLRHWSHWFATCARLLMVAATIAYSVWWAWFST
jgi:hypothetical protein